MWDKCNEQLPLSIRFNLWVNTLEWKGGKIEMEFHYPEKLSGVREGLPLNCKG